MAHVFDTSLIHPVALEAGELFARAGFELALVGGPVRDLFLGETSVDLDFTTNATPDETLAVVDGWADATWEIGKEYGTIGIRKGNEMVEITTYRAEKYDPDSRKPVVAFGTDLKEDLFRRDFTINSMALRLPSLELVDPFGGQEDLHKGIIRTPGTPQASFSDDPLRMMRAARFASRRGVDLLVESGLASFVLPEIPALKLEVDEHHRHKDVYQHSLTVMEQAAALETGADGAVPRPGFVLRFAALMHDIGKPATRKFESNGAVSFLHHDVVGAKLTKKRMRELRFDNDTIKAVARLVELHMRFYGYGDAGWSDSAVRRYVRDAGDLLERLHRLTRADVTTRNKRKANRIASAYDDLERRIAELAEQEELDAIRPDLDGEEIMAILGIKPGPQVGRAYKFLLNLRLDEGALGKEEATARLLEWSKK